MRTRDLVTFVALTTLVCVLFSMADVTAEEKAFGLDSQVRTLDFSKSVPGNLNYQGYLVSAADSSAVTATLEMTLRLFDSQTKGAELWSETHPAVEVSNGLFQVLLGSVTPFAGGLFDGSTLWLQTEVGAEVLSPRKPLVSVAYSQRAQEADHAVHADTAAYSPSTNPWTVSGDNIYRDTGKVGIGTISPSYLLDVNGPVNATTYHGDGSNLTGIGGTPDNDWTINGDTIYHETGLVGIGTDSPIYPLHVDGIASTRGLWLPGAFGPDTSYVGEDGNWIAFGHPGVSEDFLGYKSNAFYFMDSPSGADTTDPNLIIGGKVGIGTTSPDELLTLYYDSYIGWEYSSTNSVVAHKIGKTSHGAGPLEFVTTHNPGPTGKVFSFRSGAGEVLSMLHNGNVGIGTTSPEAKLHIDDDTGIYAMYVKSADTTAIVGITEDSTGTAYAGYFEGNAHNGGGVYAVSDAGEGVYGLHTHQSYTSPGVYGQNLGSGAGVLGRATKDQGVYGISNTGPGVYAYNYFTGIYSYMADTVWAGYFSGDVHISGNLGIGTTSPVSLLEIENHSDSPDVRLDAAVSGVAYLRFSQNDDQKASIKMTSSGDLQLDTEASGAAGITILNSNANVGIGTETPARTLHVDDVMRLEPRATAPSSPSMGDMYMDSTTQKLMVYDGTIWQACW